MSTQIATQTPHISRENWDSHPNFPQQVLLLGSHQSFREVSAYLIDEAATLAQPGELELLYRRWISGMRSHEAYEEHKLYPYLARRWDVSFADAEAGHLALHEKHAGVLFAFSEIRTRQLNDETRAGLVAALRAHDEVLLAHLQVEEDLVIPLLLSLAPAEFERYHGSSIRRLLRDFGGGDTNPVAGTDN